MEQSKDHHSPLEGANLHQQILPDSDDAVLDCTIRTHVPGDTSHPWVTDVVTLGDDVTPTVVVTDFDNARVKCFYNRSSASPGHSELSMHGRPRGLAVVGMRLVAVTLPYSREISLVEVNPDLRLRSTIRTVKEPMGLASLSRSRLAVGFQEPSSVNILDMSGNVLESFSPRMNNIPMLRNPWFLCTTRDGNIVVGDYFQKCVVCVTQRGDIVFNYTGPGLQGGSAGITCTESGDILVVDREGRIVLHLTSTGRYVGELLSLTPCRGRQYEVSGLDVDGQGHLYVGLSRGLKDGRVRVYRFTLSSTEHDDSNRWCTVL